MSQSKITYTKDGPFFIIKFNSPESLNAMTSQDYIHLATLLKLAEKDPEVYFTVLQSSGRFFSSGADFKFISEYKDVLTGIEKDNTGGDHAARETQLTKVWLDGFLSTNVHVTDIFINHSKVLIACLNGPVVGLSAAIVALCDIVYAMNDDVYMLCPFSRLGLTCEGGTSITLPMKLGMNSTFESLMFAQKIKMDKLMGNIVVKNYKLNDTDEFNKVIMEELKTKIKTLYLPSCLAMKKLLRSSLNDELDKMNSKEVNQALPFWVDGVPLNRFRQMFHNKQRVRGQRADSKL
ncbi:hypothetical protein NCAS_0D02990 [Naumovozyma castellii]|uniref:Enoyl-CoA hydratase/isomerase domain-containing protein n=1 Tax=Naumovozyma castellii TaxID=27288 RepID=G0VE89_NAUCA|nr:hypothetical protein NCAS_0D02990 [Naumovozyma castellii CBS 4309]CCC69880.1 hypothetical protein NCAS_0D02990 [Naumovozyma castellii CBS 4309]